MKGITKYTKGGLVPIIMASYFPINGNLNIHDNTNQKEVNKGDALLVMEAMKMEYTLKSDLKAIVEKISIEVGQQVTLGQLLVQLKESQ